MKEFADSGPYGFLTGVILGLFLTFWLGLLDERWAWQRDTIERGLAQYCPDNGRWAWKGECE